MRKIKYEIVIICPFNKCRLNQDWNKMSSACLHCEYSELKEEKVSEVVILDENSKEVKEFEQKYKHCYEDDNYEESYEGCIGLPRHSNKFYQELVETVDKSKPFFQSIEIFNTYITEELKKKKCCSCGKQIIGKGYVIHDSFGEVDYLTCNRECADRFWKR